MSLGANMKRMLVVNDMYGGAGRSMLRESILSEMNNLNRFIVARTEALCTPDSSTVSENALPGSRTPRMP